ncbi:MAG: hypothetical protein H3C31_06730 [Brumimicrobium sp.]|nr:hypothetical protein [Brumimicrobium sp.]MCO5267752.1 THUMP domain-containing protein [Brumimicrobium sp.]
MQQELITIKTLFGFEEILKEELIELGYNNIEILNRAVRIKGTWEDVYRLNFRCRLAISVLVEIKTFFIHKEDDLYKEARKIDWTSYFKLDKTFAVKGAVFSNFFKHTQFPMLLIKDAIADTFRDKYNERPDVNIKSPQVMFDVYIKDKTVTISLNTSGLPLFQRGYRQETGEAPMNEVLAAGLLRLSGWDKKSTLIDPMCGSGTIAIEAALLAADIPAMIERTHYAFKNFNSFDEEIWEKVRNEANNRPKNLGFDIFAYDIDAEMVQKAKRNSRMAPIGNMVSFGRQDFLTLEAPVEKGTIICNPPYGERIGEDVSELYQGIGDHLKHAFSGYNCWLISSNEEALKNIGLKPSQKMKVFNGNLECSFRQYSMFEGSFKEFKEGKEGDKEKPLIPIKDKKEIHTPKQADTSRLKEKEKTSKSRTNTNQGNNKYSFSEKPKNLKEPKSEIQKESETKIRKEATKKEEITPILPKQSDKYSFKDKIEELKKERK